MSSLKFGDRQITVKSSDSQILGWLKTIPENDRVWIFIPTSMNPQLTTDQLIEIIGKLDLLNNGGPIDA